MQRQHNVPIRINNSREDSGEGSKIKNLSKIRGNVLPQGFVLPFVPIV